MLAYLIDPLAKTVTAIEHDGTLQHIYRQLNCQLIDAVRLDEGDTVYIDDEGACYEPMAENGVFNLKGYPSPLFGRGMVLGSNDEGVSVEPKISLAAMTAMTVFW